MTSGAADTLSELIHHLVDSEAGRSLAGWVITDPRQKISHQALSGNCHKGMVEKPVLVGARCNVGKFLTVIAGPQASPKELRHGRGVAAVQAAIPLNLAQKWLGHARLSTTAI